jgi:cytochrome c peroxidase
LFFDERLSVDNSRSCYSCHVCQHGLTDGLPKAIGAENKQLTRNSPTLWNIGYHTQFYWDGRSDSLEKQAMGAWMGANMGVGVKTDEIVAKINALQGYRSQFQKVFQSDATAENMMQAIAAFERTIIGGNTPWDRWRAGDKSAISQSAFRGWNIFQGIGCNNCHDGLLFTDQQFHNIGIGMDQPEPDLGRFQDDEQTGRYGRVQDADVERCSQSQRRTFMTGVRRPWKRRSILCWVVGRPNQILDTKNLKPHRLAAEQREDLLNFLRALTVDALSKPPLPQN